MGYLIYLYESDLIQTNVPRSSFGLESVKKYITKDGNVTPRVKSSKDTVERIFSFRKQIGITRISDITYLDRLYIPNYSVTLPGTEDSIWVYGGKGATKTQAEASALMESLERYCSLPSSCRRNLVKGTYVELSKSYNKVLHPDEVVEPVAQGYNTESSTMEFLLGFDLMNNEEVLVPAQLAFSKFTAKPPCVDAFLYSHTNGLASGNVLEEAICHALCEVIERDAASISDLIASSIPYTILDRLIFSLKNVGYLGKGLTDFHELEFVDDLSIFNDVDISEIANEFEPIKYLVKRFIDSGISLLVKNITQFDIGIPSFVASSIEWITNDYGYFAKGYGTHPDAKIALVRAITELSQTRAANIQGARDDFKKIQYRENDEIYKRKWQFIPTISSSTMKHNSEKKIMFSEIKQYVKDDILDDIKLIINRLKKAGLRRAIVVNLSIPELGIPVVRAIVPGLETFEVAKLFTNTELLMGRRAKIHFRKILTG